MADLDEFRAELTKELSVALDVPESMLSGAVQHKISDKELLKFITRIAATQKGMKRKMRRLRAHVSKMVRKGKISHVYRRH